MRNKGIGKQLLKCIFDYAKDLGYSEMSVGVDLDNYVAILVYHKYGFDKLIKVAFISTFKTCQKIIIIN